MVLNLWNVWCLYWYANYLSKTLINFVTLAISGMSLLIIPTITLLKKNLQNLRQYQDSDVKEVNISPITV